MRDIWKRIKKGISRFFINERIVMTVIVLNAVVIYAEESGAVYPSLYVLDTACTLFFIIEMLLKIRHLGWQGYWKDGWNRMDGILVIISLPPLILPFINVEVVDLSILLTLRLLRVLRFLRLLHFFPRITQLVAGLKRAVQQSGFVLTSFAVLIVIFGLINCSLYKEVVPQYFGTPLKSIYTVFRILTVEGWYEIPDTIATATTPLIGKLSQVYFCLLLGLGGILGLSFINSVFVDAMMEDNNDDVKEQLRVIEKKIDALNQRIDTNENDAQ